MRVLEDAWRTIAPSRDDHNGPLPPLLLCLTVVTGLVDAFSYLVLGHVFVANMTGNVVFLAFALAGAHGFSIAASLTAIAAFALGAGSGGRLASVMGSNRGRLLATSSLVEAAFLCGSLVLAAVVASPASGSARYILIVLLGFAMGTQNATARKLAIPDLTTTVLTLTITGLSADSRAAGGSDSKIGRRGLSVLSMFVGALVGSLFIVHQSSPPVIAIAFVATALVAGTTLSAIRSKPAWTAP
jgi:uncharacterized membrane protein YoaK (UPF0700 family)